jgi:thiamine kinase-like enzyme
MQIDAINPNSAMEKKIVDLDCWKGKVEPVKINRGHTNHNFAVEDRGEKFFIRLGDDLPFHCVMRFNEAAVSRAAHVAGISPEIVWCEPGVMVSRYVDGKTLTNYDITQQDRLDRLVPLIRRCHTQIADHLRGPVLMFWVFHVCRNYAAILKENAHPIGPRLPWLMEMNQQLEKAVGNINPVLTHNDLLAANFIDDGNRIWIIDWEYSGFNTPLFDLACFCSFCDLSQARIHQVLEIYFESLVTQKVYRTFLALKCASELWTYLWSLVAEIHKPLDLDYQKIAAGHWMKFENAWQDFIDS